MKCATTTTYITFKALSMGEFPSLTLFFRFPDEALVLVLGSDKFFMLIILVLSILRVDTYHVFFGPKWKLFGAFSGIFVWIDPRISHLFSFEMQCKIQGLRVFLENVLYIVKPVIPSILSITFLSIPYSRNYIMEFILKCLTIKHAS